MLYYPFIFLSTNLMAFISIMLSLLVGMMALYLYNSGAFTRTARKLWYRRGHAHDDKSRSRCIAQNLEGASRYPHVSPSLPLRGTDRPQAFNEALSLHGLWRGRGETVHSDCGRPRLSSPRWAHVSRGWWRLWTLVYSRMDHSQTYPSYPMAYSRFLAEHTCIALLGRAVPPGVARDQRCRSETISNQTSAIGCDGLVSRQVRLREAQPNYADTMRWTVQFPIPNSLAIARMWCGIRQLWYTLRHSMRGANAHLGGGLSCPGSSVVADADNESRKWWIVASSTDMMGCSIVTLTSHLMSSPML